MEYTGTTQSLTDKQLEKLQQLEWNCRNIFNVFITN